ncbi:MAG: response regulator [Planctomycetes bacterium]|nr:response regulator [Planctomycetota bacterium]
MSRGCSRSVAEAPRRRVCARSQRPVVSDRRGRTVSVMPPPTILLADNDRAVSSLLVELLKRFGVTAVPAYDGEDAKVRGREPGLAAIVCDLDMPRASGVEVLESLADLPAPPPAIVISGFVDEAVRARLARLPFVRAILRKPFDLLAFARTVRSIAEAAAGEEA